MAAGKLSNGNPTALTTTLMYTVPSGKSASVNINVVNTGLVAERATLYISDSTTTDNTKILEWRTLVPASGGVLERTGLMLSEGERVYVLCSSSNFAIRIHGFED